MIGGTMQRFIFLEENVARNLSLYEVEDLIQNMEQDQWLQVTQDDMYN